MTPFYAPRWRYSVRSMAGAPACYAGIMNIADVRGVIFDVDDTLLSNFPPEFPLGLHEHSRLRVAHEIGKRRGIAGLQNFTPEQSFQAFQDSPEHSVHGAIWQMLIMAGQVSGAMQRDHPLVVEMVDLKEELHEDVLRQHGREVPGASKFVEALAHDYGLADRLAVASTSNPRDINLFFDTHNLHRFFPPERIISREKFTYAKPHPEAFELAFKTLGLPSKTGVIAFEDDPRGVQSAKGAGLYVCAITTRIKREDFEKMDTPPDHIADSYADFRRHLGM